MSGFSSYDIAKFHDDREGFDNNHCPHGESWGDPCNECWSSRDAQEANNERLT